MILLLNVHIHHCSSPDINPPTPTPQLKHILPRSPPRFHHRFFSKISSHHLIASTYLPSSHRAPSALIVASKDLQSTQMRVFPILMVLQDLDLHQMRTQHRHLRSVHCARRRWCRVRTQAAKGQTGRWAGECWCFGVSLGRELWCELWRELGRAMLRQLRGGDRCIVHIEGLGRFEMCGEVRRNALSLRREWHVL